MIGSIPDLAIIAILGMVLFGAKNIPELGRNLGKGLREFKSGVTDLKDEIESGTLEQARVVEAVTSRETAVTAPTLANPVSSEEEHVAKAH
jgi:sec-independent protein translocase protein TatA